MHSKSHRTIVVGAAVAFASAAAGLQACSERGELPSSPPPPRVLEQRFTRPEPAPAARNRADSAIHAGFLKAKDASLAMAVRVAERTRALPQGWSRSPSGAPHAQTFCARMTQILESELPARGPDGAPINRARLAREIVESVSPCRPGAAPAAILERRPNVVALGGRPGAPAKGGKATRPTSQAPQPLFLEDGDTRFVDDGGGAGGTGGSYATEAEVTAIIDGAINDGWVWNIAAISEPAIDQMLAEMRAALEGQPMGLFLQSSVNWYEVKTAAVAACITSVWTNKWNVVKVGVQWAMTNASLGAQGAAAFGLFGAGFAAAGYCAAGAGGGGIVSYTAQKALK